MKNKHPRRESMLSYTLKEDTAEIWQMIEKKEGIEINHDVENWGSSVIVIPWRSIRAALRRKDKK